MREFFKVSIHVYPTPRKQHEKYYDESYNITKDSSGFLVCRNKDKKHFTNWIDQLHHPRNDIDISVYAKEHEKNGFKNMNKELPIIAKFFKTVKKSKIKKLCGKFRYFEMYLFKFENNKKKIDSGIEIDEDNRTNYFIAFDINCPLDEIYGMKEFKEKLKEKGIYRFQDWDNIHTAIFLKKLSVRDIHKACNKMIQLLKIHSELVDDMNKAREKYFKRLITRKQNDNSKFWS